VLTRARWWLLPWAKLIQPAPFSDFPFRRITIARYPHTCTFILTRFSLKPRLSILTGTTKSQLPINFDKLALFYIVIVIMMMMMTIIMMMVIYNAPVTYRSDIRKWKQHYSLKCMLFRSRDLWLSEWRLMLLGVSAWSECTTYSVLLRHISFCLRVNFLHLLYTRFISKFNKLYPVTGCCEVLWPIGGTMSARAMVPGAGLCYLLWRHYPEAI
jgi:hypothetical protein